VTKGRLSGWGFYENFLDKVQQMSVNSGMNRTERIVFRVTPREKERALLLSQHKGLRLPDYLRRMITSEADKNEIPED
jgi:hypothetical protein